MKIIDKCLKQTYFEALEPGDVFSAIFEGDEIIAIKLEKPEMEENAVGLADGTVYHLSDNEPVRPVHAELIIS